MNSSIYSSQRGSNSMISVSGEDDQRSPPVRARPWDWARKLVHVSLHVRRQVRANTNPTIPALRGLLLAVRDQMSEAFIECGVAVVHVV
jgi:hypothetical protein